MAKKALPLGSIISFGNTVAQVTKVYPHTISCRELVWQRKVHLAIESWHDGAVKDHGCTLPLIGERRAPMTNQPTDKDGVRLRTMYEAYDGTVFESHEEAALHARKVKAYTTAKDSEMYSGGRVDFDTMEEFAEFVLKYAAMIKGDAND